jgi:hypothetical protein
MKPQTNLLLTLGAFALLALTPSPAARADELTLYVYPSPFGINWTTPSSVAWSGIESEAAFDPRFKDVHSLGHAQIELNCAASSSGPEQYFFSGMTNNTDNEFVKDLLGKGYGLGLLLGSFAGHEEKTSDIETDLPARYSSGRISFIRFGINSDTCQRVASYLQEYHELGYDQIYGGLSDRPRYREGAGCTAFAEGVLEVAGIMEPSWYIDWTRSIQVQRNLVGGPLTQTNVDLIEVLFGKDSKAWATANEPSFSVFFWDPDRMFNWINQSYEAVSADPSIATYIPEKRGEAMGLYLDRTNAPTPTDSFWKTD